MSAPVTVYVPQDAGAVSVGADAVADALRTAGGERVRVVRTGSRGLAWLEPLIEVETPAGRIAYGPVTSGDVDDLVVAGLLDGAPHRLCQGPTDDIPWLRDQDRVTFARVGVIDPASPDDYVAHGGLRGLERALGMAPEAVVDEVEASGLRGRGGAGFPAGRKWRTVAQAPAGPRYICCNADEGDSGTFADRMLLEGDPFSLIEGMAIAAHAVGAAEGYVYVRSEYPEAVASLRRAIAAAYEHGWLGESVLGSDLRFDLHVHVGAGAYVCGEETAMLESIEGRRGVVRTKPPIPAAAGLFGAPTLVGNVLTLATATAVLADGAAAYAARGVDTSRGTQVFQLGGNIARGGIVETPFGITLERLVYDFGGGAASGRPVKAVQVGGPLGAYLRADALDVPLAYESLADAGGMLGHGGIVVFDDTVDMAQQARHAMRFCAAESCGRCTPCRLGSRRGVEILDALIAGDDPEANLALLDDLCEVMRNGSLCGLGGMTPLPVTSAVRGWPEDFTARETREGR